MCLRSVEAYPSNYAPQLRTRGFSSGNNLGQRLGIGRTDCQGQTGMRSCCFDTHENQNYVLEIALELFRMSVQERLIGLCKLEKKRFVKKSTIGSEFSRKMCKYIFFKCNVYSGREIINSLRFGMTNSYFLKQRNTYLVIIQRELCQKF